MSYQETHIVPINKAGSRQVSQISQGGTVTRQVSQVSTGGAQRQVSERFMSSSVVGRETMEGVVTHSKDTQGAEYVVREYAQQHQQKVMKKRMVEETIEEVIIVPKTIMREEEYEEIEMVTENIVEVARPVVKEVFIEVKEIEHVEEIIEVEEHRIEEVVIPIDKVEYQEVINYIPRTEFVDKIVEVPQVKYIEKIVNVDVEVPTYKEEIRIVEKPVTRYVDVPVQKMIDKHVDEEISRVVPRPVEHIIRQNFHLQSIEPNYRIVKVPVEIPHFIEVPVPAEMLTRASLQKANDLCARVAAAQQNNPSMCELEALAHEANDINLEVETDANIRWSTLAEHLDTQTVVVNTSSGQQYGRKVSVQVYNREETIGA